MKKPITLIAVSLIIGTFITVQARSFRSIGDMLIGRDANTNIFQEIQLLMETNKSLETEITSLETNLDQLSDRASALGAIEDSINKYSILDGQVSVYGPGVELEISDNIATIWLVDLANELFSGGAEALSINDIRLTNYTHGFDTLPQGQILFNGNILQPPLVIKAIGDPDALESLMNQPKGILDKLYESNSKLKIKLSKKDKIEMAKVI